MVTRPHICDYCSDWKPKHVIKLSRTPNGEKITVELCDTCLNDIKKYIESL
jgi:hypothetical protein